MREKASVFAAGAVGYGGLEILYRGYTHWTMAVTGGICLLILWRIAAGFSHRPLWLQGVLGGLCITLAEFVVGLIVNVGLGWSVWDYSQEYGNILGQICPLYTLYWMLLAGGILGALRFVRHLRARRKAGRL